MMARDEPLAHDLANEDAPRRRRPLAARLLVWAAALVVALFALAGIALVALNTGPGRDLVVRQIENLAPASGLRIQVGRIEGSLYDRLVIHDLALADPQGVFLTSPRVVLDWRPFAFIGNDLVISEALSPQIRLLRMPQLVPSGRQDQPLLPSFDIHIGRLAIEQLILEEPVIGQRALARIEGSADIRAGRAIVELKARSDAGDRLALDLEAVPDAERFDLEARLAAPVGGIVANLAGLTEPATLAIEGEGDWSSWHGRAVALLGGAPFANLRLAVDDGRFGVDGFVVPPMLLGPGLPAQLTGPRLAIAGTVEPGDERIAFQVNAQSSALTLTAEGALDTARSRLEAVAARGRLLEPSAIAPELAGGPVVYRAQAEGPLAAPTVAFTAEAPRLAYGSIVAQRLAVTGQVRPTTGPGPLVVPLTFTAARVSGLDATADDLLRNVHAQGRVILDEGAVRAQGFVLRSDRGKARVDLSYATGTGLYDATVQGSLPRFPIPGLGVADLTADIRARPGPAGGVAVSGPFRAIFRRLDNATLRDLAGGNPTITGVASVGPSGAIGARDIRIRAPGLNLTGSAQLQPGGALDVEAQGRSAEYGPVELRVTGTQAAPQVDVALESPGFGLGLADLQARIRPAEGGYDVGARGASSYGPFTADARILTGGGPLTVELQALSIAGLTASGRIQQAGPVYAGDLDIRGPGIAGDIDLANAAGNQRVEAELRFNAANISALDPDVVVRQGAVQAVATLLPGGPRVTGTARLSGVRRGGLTLETLAAQVNYAQGTGRAQIAVEGRGEAPFALRSNVVATPQRITVAAQGSVAGEKLALAQPATLVNTDAGWTLQPATLILPDGRAVLAGSLGETPSLTARLISVGLEPISDALDLAIRGSLSGTVQARLTPSGLPQGTVELQLENFSRSGLAVSSLPVDLQLTGALRNNAGALRGFIRREGRVLGAFQAQLNPIPGDPGDPAVQRLLSAPLRGQLRIQAPAEAIWPLTGVGALDVRGPIGINAALGGYLGEPNIRGQVRATGARLENAALGTVITDIETYGTFSGPRLVFQRFSGKTPNGGSVAGTGTVGYTAQSGLTIDLRGQLENAQLLRLDQLRAAATGPARLQLGPDGGLISGKVEITRAEYRVGGAAAAEIPTIEVREVGLGPGERAEEAPEPTVWRVDVSATANNRIYVRGMGLDSEWEADVKITGPATQPRIQGLAELIRGEYVFSGREFELTRGIIRFQGDYPPNPELAIVAEASVEGLTAQINIGGSALAPEITFSSVPALPQEEVLARLLFGASVTDLSAPEALQLAAAVASLQGGGGGPGFNPITLLRQATGLDRLRLEGGDENTGQGTTLAAGKYLGDDIYLEVSSDAQGFTATSIEYELTRSLSILSRVASFGGNAVALRWSKDY